MSADKKLTKVGLGYLRAGRGSDKTRIVNKTKIRFNVTFCNFGELKTKRPSRRLNRESTSKKRAPLVYVFPRYTSQVVDY